MPIQEGVKTSEHFGIFMFFQTHEILTKVGSISFDFTQMFS